MTSGLLLLIVRKARFARQVAHTVRLEPGVIELRRLLEELDRRLRRLNLERAAHETLHQFAERLRAVAASRATLQDAAEWYLRYAATRYGIPNDVGVQESLRAELQTVFNRLNERRSAP
jgi:hypothetical protein